MVGHKLDQQYPARTALIYITQDGKASEFQLVHSVYAVVSAAGPQACVAA